MDDGDGIVVFADEVEVSPGLWLAEANRHGLRWKATGGSRQEAVDKAFAAAATGVWVGRPMAEAPQFIP